MVIESWYVYFLGLIDVVDVERGRKPHLRRRLIHRFARSDDPPSDWLNARI